MDKNLISATSFGFKLNSNLKRYIKMCSAEKLLQWRCSYNLEVNLNVAMLQQQQRRIGFGAYLGCTVHDDVHTFFISRLNHVDEAL